MNKKYAIGFFVFILVAASVSAIIVLENGYLLNREEMSGVSNQTISNYMANTFALADYKIMEDKIVLYYNITYLEPGYIYDNVTNTTVTGYRVFTQYKPFVIRKNTWNSCLEVASETVCTNVLVTSPTPFVYEDNSSGVAKNVTLKSTYLQAYEEQERQYYRAVAMRNNALSNDLDELFSRINSS